VKIPTLDVPRVAPSGRGAPTLQSVQPGGFDAVARGAAQLGQAVGGVGERYEREQDQARQKAIAADTTDGETELTRWEISEWHGDGGSGNEARDTVESAFTGEATVKPGFASTQGRAAAEKRADVLERHEKKRKEIADNMSTDEARELFLGRTGRQALEFRSRVESHVQQQRRVADVASLKARAEAALEAIRKNVGNGALVEQQSLALEGPIQALSLSPEDAKADLRNWHRSVIATRLDVMLEQGNWQAAEGLYNDTSATLGKEGKVYGDRIAKVKGAAEAEETVAGIVAGARLPNGEVDEAKALRALDGMPEEQRAKLETSMAAHLARERKAWDAETERVGRESYTIVNRIGWQRFLGTPLEEQLNQRDPKLWDSLRNGDQRDLDRLERKSRIRANNAAALREQKDIDAIALNEWDTELLRDPAAADPERFKAMHREMSPRAVSEIAERKARAEKGWGVELSKAVTDLRAELRDYAPPPGRNDREKRDEKAWWAARQGELTNAYTDWQERNPGKRPTTEEVVRMKADVIAPLVPRTAAGAQRSGQALQRKVAPPLSSRTIKSYLRSPDGKRRVPVYTDGTRGPEEAVP
jgi:hypothetical protein